MERVKCYLGGYYRTKGTQKESNEEIMHKIPHRMCGIVLVLVCGVCVCLFNVTGGCLMPHNTQCMFVFVVKKAANDTALDNFFSFFFSFLPLSQHPALSFSFRYGQYVMMAHFDYIEDFFGR